MPNHSKKLSALIISFNEMGYIEKCIKSIEFADEIIVVDSYSTDGTYEYLVNHPKVKVIQHPFSNFTAQKSFTLEQASNDWVLFMSISSNGCYSFFIYCSIYVYIYKQN